jgi:hypothetical protein
MVKSLRTHLSHRLRGWSPFLLVPNTRQSQPHLSTYNVAALSSKSRPVEICVDEFKFGYTRPNSMEYSIRSGERVPITRADAEC